MLSITLKRIQDPSKFVQQEFPAMCEMSTFGHFWENSDTRDVATPFFDEIPERVFLRMNLRAKHCL